MKTIPQISVDSQILGKRLCKLSVGEEISYQQLAAIVPGRVLNGKDRNILYTAIRYALRESKVVIETVRGKGVKRLEDSEMANLAEFATPKIRRTCVRTSRKILCANYDALSDDDKLKFNTGLSVLGAIQQFTTAKAYDSINAAVTKQSNRIGFNETLALFAK